MKATFGKKRRSRVNVDRNQSLMWVFFMTYSVSSGHAVTSAHHLPLLVFTTGWRTANDLTLSKNIRSQLNLNQPFLLISTTSTYFFSYPSSPWGACQNVNFPKIARHWRAAEENEVISLERWSSQRALRHFLLFLFLFFIIKPILSHVCYKIGFISLISRELC